MEKNTETGVVIVSLNGRKHLERLMPSLLAQRRQPDHIVVPNNIVVIDNGSCDGTVDWLSKNHPMVHIIAFENNLGFALPNNYGISYLCKNPDIKYIACINNDTVLPDDFFSRLISFAEQQDGMIGALQTKIVSYDFPSIIDSVGITINHDMSAINEGQGEHDKGQFEVPGEIFGATASAVIYTRKALDALRQSHGEYFDADYFAYQEDVDLAFRMRLLGYCAWYVPGRPVLHVHSATGENHSPFKSYHIHRNTLYTLVKNMPGILLLSGMFHFLKKYGALLGSLSKKQGPSYELSKKAGISGMVGIVFKAWFVFILHLPSLLAKRRRIQKTKKTSIAHAKEWFADYRADLKKIAYGIRPSR